MCVLSCIAYTSLLLVAHVLAQYLNYDTFITRLSTFLLNHLQLLLARYIIYYHLAINLGIVLLQRQRPFRNAIRIARLLEWHLLICYQMEDLDGYLDNLLLFSISILESIIITSFSAFVVD